MTLCPQCGKETSSKWGYCHDHRSFSADFRASRKEYIHSDEGRLAKLKERGKRYREENKETISESQAAWRARNADYLKEFKRQAYDPEVARNWKLQKAYGIDSQGYAELLSSQGGGCALCGVSEDQSGRSLPVDHCHETGAVRGILCSNCNNGLGRFQDNPELMRAAADYVERHRS